MITSPISVAPSSLSSWAVTSRTFSMILTAVTFQETGLQWLFQFATNCLMSALSTFTEVCVPRRISCRVIMPFQISIMFNQDAPGWREVKDDPAVVLGQPLLGILGFVRRRVIPDHVDLFLATFFHHGVHKSQEVRSRVGSRQIDGHLPGPHVLARVQVGGAVPHVVVRAFGGLAEVGRDHCLGAV